MSNKICVLLILFICSCGVVSKIKGDPDGMHSWYASALTPSEKELLENQPQLIKKHQMYDRKGHMIEEGELLVEKRGKVYNFVEIGKWNVNFPKQNALDVTIGIYHIEKKYDSKGNLIAQEVFLQEKFDTLRLVEEMHSSIDTINNVRVLLQYWKIFYKNESLKDISLKESFCHASPDFEKLLSDRFKPKYKHGKHMRFAKNGTIISSTLK